MCYSLPHRLHKDLIDLSTVNKCQSIGEESNLSEPQNHIGHNYFFLWRARLIVKFSLCRQHSIFNCWRFLMCTNCVQVLVVCPGLRSLDVQLNRVIHCSVREYNHFLCSKHTTKGCETNQFINQDKTSQSLSHHHLHTGTNTHRSSHRYKWPRNKLNWDHRNRPIRDYRMNFVNIVSIILSTWTTVHQFSFMQHSHDKLMTFTWQDNKIHITYTFRSIKKVGMYTFHKH